jgi:hypothetical protein
MMITLTATLAVTAEKRILGVLCVRRGSRGN